MSGIGATTILGVLMGVALAGPASAADALVVRAARVFTVSGPPLEGATVIVRDGRIAKIGRDAAVPEGALVIDAGDGCVMPGLIDANARFAARGDANEQSDEITPDFDVLGAIDRDSRHLKRALQLGVTALRVVPGNANVIAGTAVVIKSRGESLEAMVVKRGGSLKVVMGNDSTGGNRLPRSSRPTSFYYRQPTTRMGIVWLLRQALFKAKTALERGEPLPPDRMPLADALKGKLPVEISLRSAVDLETALQVADEFGLRKLTFIECTEGYKLAGDIARRDIPVILGPVYIYPRTWLESYEAWDVNWNNAGLLSKAGVRIAFGSNDPGGPADLLTWAAMAHRNGLPHDAALRALTANAAHILGVADRLGTLAAGKDADLLVLTGDPLQPTTRVAQVIVDGQVAYDAQSGASADAKG